MVLGMIEGNSGLVIKVLFHLRIINRNACRFNRMSNQPAFIDNHAHKEIQRAF